MIKKHTPKTQKLSREENVGEITQGVTRLLEKITRIKCHTKINRLKVALI